MIEILYIDRESASRPLGFSVVDASGSVWSPAAARFVAPTANGGPADGVVPMTRRPGPNWSCVCAGSAPGCPDPAAGRPYTVLIHPAGGGPPVGEPVVVASTPATIRGNFAVVMS